MSTGIATTNQMLRPHGDDHDDPGMLRLHQNESPHGAPAAAIAAAMDELSGRHAQYPDPQCAAFQKRVARALAVQPDRVAVANGTDELIQLIVLSHRSTCGRSTPVVGVTDRTFPGYAAAAAVAGVRTHTMPTSDFRVVPGAVVDAFHHGVTLAFICDPHNPNGTALDLAGVEEILAAARETGALAVFDEAYVEFLGSRRAVALDAARDGGSAVVLRTFSKAWGLAALRAGYAVGPAALMGAVRRTRQATPFSVNRPAQRAAIAALDHPDFVVEVRDRTVVARARLCAGLAALGVGFVPSETNFVMVRLDTDSGAVAERLAVDHRVLVRDLAPLGRPGCLRVTVGTTGQVDRFCAALGTVLGRLAAPMPGR